MMNFRFPSIIYMISPDLSDELEEALRSFVEAAVEHGGCRIIEPTYNNLLCEPPYREGQLCIKAGRADFIQQDDGSALVVIPAYDHEESHALDFMVTRIPPESFSQFVVPFPAFGGPAAEA